jgi:hypothetical protein
MTPAACAVVSVTTIRIVVASVRDAATSARNADVKSVRIMRWN